MRSKKKKNYLLVDGYNIIHAWEELKPYIEDSLFISRLELIDIMSNYAGYTDEIIVIVFDAHKVVGNVGTYEKHDNIHVIYTKEKQTADTYIEKFVATHSHEYEIKVATSDVMEQIIILGRGASRINAKQLHNYVFNITKDMEEKYLDNKPIKKNLFYDNLPPEMAKYFDEERRKKGR